MAVAGINVADGAIDLLEALGHAAGSLALLGTLGPVDGLANERRGPLRRTCSVEVLGNTGSRGRAMDTATDGDGIVVVGEGLLEVGVHLEDAVVVPELDLALEDLRQDAAGEVEAGGSVGDAGDVVEDGDGAEDEGEVDHLLAGGGEGRVVGVGDGDVAGAEVVVRDVGVGSGVVDAEELLLAGGGTDGPVREADGLLGPVLKLVH
mmetsp:Transcript_10647/g.29951  ORF Transcript_10647/g.29951 Transcript_10647/m.29951 type:complete len:206 (-) Transcript_10647:149-766(-)